MEALTLADRIAVMRQGRIVQVGTPRDIYDRPASLFVAQLVGTPRINLLDATYSDGALNIVDSPIRFAQTSANGLPATLTLGVRPEDVQPAPDGDFAGEVALVEPLGVETILHIQSGEQTLLSTVGGMAKHGIGESVRFNIVRERLHFFDKDGARIMIE